MRDSFVIFFLTLSLIFRAYDDESSISTYVYHDDSVVRHLLRNREVFGSNPTKDTVFFLTIFNLKLKKKNMLKDVTFIPRKKKEEKSASIEYSLEGRKLCIFIS